MLYGPRFLTSSKQKIIFSSIQAKDSIINCNTLEMDITKLSGRPNPNDPILVQIQSRGVGKTKSIYDLGMKKDLLYFDFTCDQYGGGTKYSNIASCLNSINNLTKNKNNNYEDYQKLRQETKNIFMKLFLCGLIHHGIFRNIFKDESSEFFLRYSMNGGAKILDHLFNIMLDYDINSIRNIAFGYESDIIFAYDEVGCLVKAFNGKFLSKNAIEANKISDEILRGLFDVFSDAILSMRPYRYYQSKILYFL